MESTVYRLFVERKSGFDNEAKRALAELTGFLGITGLQAVRYLNRYDIQGVSRQTLETAARQIFSESQSDLVSFESFDCANDETVIALEYLPGQYDQRADSASQCLALLSGSEERAIVRCARLFVLKGSLTTQDLERVRRYLINPVDSREADSAQSLSLVMKSERPEPVAILSGFTSLSSQDLEAFRTQKGLAMDGADIRFLQQYFAKEGRDPTDTEIRVLDTYWSDHCRHTTFNTVLEDIAIPEGPEGQPIRDALAVYSGLRLELYGDRAQGRDGSLAEKPVTLMDMAVIGAKALKKRGLLDDIEESAEINACSVFIDVQMLDTAGNNTGCEKWLLMFKNETHNHPTEIEPFGGAATCIGGAIRDPLSGRAWVYQALRVTGAADPRSPIEKTLPGKLPQIKLTREAAAGFSAYGNQIGLATGQVIEYYDPGFLAKRMELGAVIAAAPLSHVVREEPENGDIVILVGGGTGRDGIGGATGSSKVHTEESVTTAGAEVQKGNAVEERKIQRLFRDGSVTRLIKRCNDFGAGGVAVAVGELASGLDIDLDSVPKKYEGLNGTELAISESQERMAVVVREEDALAFIKAANGENLNAAIIARVTGNNRLVMRWQGQTIVDIDRAFLDTAGAQRNAKVSIEKPGPAWDWGTAKGSGKDRLLSVLSHLSVAGQRGLTERFDGSIGSSAILFPFGGTYQATPAAGMASRIPVGPGKETTTASLMTMGYDPKALSWSPFHGAQYAVLESLTKILALGGDPRKARLTFQEYFERTSSSQAWGKPTAALLGALTAQLEAGVPAIGGKDSMSGTFGELSVPPTLVSFAVATTDQALVRDGALTTSGKQLVLIMTPWKADKTPDWQAFRSIAKDLLQDTVHSHISAAYPVTAGGIFAAVAKMSFGNRIGVHLDSAAIEALSIPEIFTRSNSGDTALTAPLYGSLIVETDGSGRDLLIKTIPSAVCIGHTTDEEAVVVGQERIPLADAQHAWEAPLASVFPAVSSVTDQETLPAWACQLYQGQQASEGLRAPQVLRTAKPRVIIPVFPGTNCEYDMERAFRLSGADTRILPLRNRTKEDLNASLDELRSAIRSSEILALSGGFSAGDEPDGSGKFIANILREHSIQEAILDLVHQRKGLVLGICNGFQALIKVGLVPFGQITPPLESNPTLTYNTVGRHISRFSLTRIASNRSPWALGPGLEPGSVHCIPFSHGEGRVIIQEELARRLFQNGQVFTQYVDQSGTPVMQEPDNPNGSLYAIEGMTDETGRILGKMGHNERPLDPGADGRSANLYKNIRGNTCQNIFAAGVRYFKE